MSKVDDAIEMLAEKVYVKGYRRQSKTGAAVTVRAHTDKRPQGKGEPLKSETQELPDGYGGRYTAQGTVGTYKGRPILRGGYQMSAEKTWEEIERVGPLSKKVGQAWKRAIQAHDPKAKFEIRLMSDYLDKIKQQVAEGNREVSGTWVSLEGKASDGNRFLLELTLHPHADGNNVYMDDSSLPASLKRKGIFTAGLRVLERPEFNINGKMAVHFSTNDRAWRTISRKMKWNWKEWQEGKWTAVPDKALPLFFKFHPGRRAEDKL